MVVEVEDGFLVVETSRRLNLESLCDPAGSLDRFTRARARLRSRTTIYLPVAEYYSGTYLSPPKKRRDNVILRVNATGRVDEREQVPGRPIARSDNAGQ